MSMLGKCDEVFVVPNPNPGASRVESTYRNPPCQHAMLEPQDFIIQLSDRSHFQSENAVCEKALWGFGQKTLWTFL